MLHELSRCLPIAVFMLSNMAMAAPTVTVLSDHAIQIEGDVDKEFADAVLAALARGVTSITVTSYGGDQFRGQDMADEIQKRDVKVIVDKYCMSSCANNIFLAAKHKVLKPNAVLGFHGGTTCSDSIGQHDDHDNAMLKAAHEMRRNACGRYSGFMKLIGVDKALIDLSFNLTKPPIRHVWLSVEDIDGVVTKFDDDAVEQAMALAKELTEKKRLRNFDISSYGLSSDKVYFPSRQTLEHFGVKGIEQYPYPSDQTHMDRIAKSIYPELQVLGDYSRKGSRTVIKTRQPEGVAALQATATGK